MNKRHERLAAHIRQAAELYLAQVARLDELTVARFATFAGVDTATVSKVFPRQQWNELRHNWVVDHLRRIMNDLYQAATTQEDFSAHRIAKRAHVSPADMLRVVGDEWRALQATLPTYQQYIQGKVYTTLQEMINTDTPVAELTTKRLAERSGVSPQKSAWYTQALQAARLELRRRSTGVGRESPTGANVRIFSGGWVDLDAASWDLTFAGRPILARDRLRPDFADLAWSELRDELLQGEQALATVARHYQAFLWAGTLLGKEVPDVRLASLEAVQRAWVRYEGTHEQRRRARTALVRLFEALFMLEDLDPAVNKAELGRIAGWLKTMVTLPSPQTEGEFLSERELNAVLKGCLTDIAAGVAFTEGEPDLASMSTRPGVSNNAAVVVQWAVALMILLMAFTGLRRESITGLRIDDWTEMRQGLFALAWRHSKKGEEHAAVLSAALADQLNLYVHRTSALRAALGTPLVFLVGDKQVWSVIRPQRLQMRLHDFVQRHGLQRDGVALPLSSTILRRTFTTRALYEGRSIQALRLQLGHTSLASTLRYGQFDRFEHPAEVSNPLDGYGRKVLTLWCAPLLLDDLAPNERASLLGASAERQQDVGLCRQRSCVKAERGSPPPCSLCEHLVTGPAFLEAWKTEYAQRARELQALEAEPTAGMLLAQMQAQFERFAANFAFVFERSRP